MSEDFPDELLAGLELLDRQLVDVDEYLVGKIDDLEIEILDTGDGRPIVTAILSGPGALAGRVGGRLGRLVAALHRRLHMESDPGPARIPFELVARIRASIELDAHRYELATYETERWARDVFISKIPGARNEAE